jgi:cytochrome c biogenesis protein CcmG/thiol:disulfide interchange protein DsbE
MAPDGRTTPSGADTASRRITSRARLVAVAIVAVAVPIVLLGIALRSGETDADGPAASATGLIEDPAVPGVAEIGSRAPGFVLETSEGERYELTGRPGRPVVVTFWASWCIPCTEEMPLLQEALDERPGEFDVLAIGFRNLPKDDARWLAGENITIPSLQDPDHEVALAYGVRGIPQTFFIDADGVIRDRVFGITSRGDLGEPLDALVQR